MGVAVDIILKNVYKSAQYKKHATSNTLLSIRKRFDDAVMVMPNDQALAAYQFASVAAFLATVRNPIHVAVMKAMNPCQTDQMCKK